MRIFASVLSFALLACHPSEAPGPDPTQGQPSTSGGAGESDPIAGGGRLKARFVDGDDGSRSFVGMWDTGTDAPCVYRTSSDGVLRCLPDVPVTTAFMDAACSKPAILVSCNGYAPPYVLRSTGVPGCGAERLEVHALGPEAAGTSYFVLAPNGSCGQQQALLPAWHLYTTNDAADLSTFVAGTESRE